MDLNPAIALTAQAMLAFAVAMTISAGKLSASQPLAVEVVPVEKLGAVKDVAEAKITGFEYHPRELRVKAGTTVVWTNEDRVDHEVMVVGRLSPVSFDVRSPLVNYGEKIAMTFNEPGTYAYICGVHPFMQASVIVEPAEEGRSE